MKARQNNPFVKGIYVNREYSWIQFNKRVLDQANDLSNPLLERCKFLSIFCSNLDEFFMVRVGSLLNETRVTPDVCENKTGLTPQQQIDGILQVCRELYAARGLTFSRLSRELKKDGVRLLRGKDLSERQKKICRELFLERILPLLSPMVLDAKHPMMRFENMHLYMMYELEKEGRDMYGIMAVSPKLEKIYAVGGGKRINLITLEELVRLFGEEAFSGYRVKSSSMFRVTRNADFDALMEDADVEHDFDFSKYLKSKIETRGSLAAVRVETDGQSDGLKSLVLKTLGVKKQSCFTVEHHFDYKFLFSLSKFIPEEKSRALRYPPFKGRIPSACENAFSLISEVEKRDLFLAYPFDSMEPLIRLLNECAESPKVVSIKITIYRLDKYSRIVEALKKASENGKEVTVVMELCARFDEENNLHFAGVLQEAGCTILYGVSNYKVHSKIVSVVLSDEGGLRYITHLGTGNYNESTARQYTDLNIITSDREIGEDGVAFFRNIAIANVGDRYQKLLIAPNTLKSGLIACIDREIEKAREGRPASIFCKMNSLTDKQIIDKLAYAGRCGVKVRLIVRGICCLLAGVPGQTDNIRVISIVGRFLEHSRVYCFGEGEDRIMYISSADLMTRNTDRRVEIATPVLDPEIAADITRIMETMWKDNVKARRLMPDGSYRPVDAVGEAVDAQQVLLYRGYEEKTV